MEKIFILAISLITVALICLTVTVNDLVIKVNTEQEQQYLSFYTGPDIIHVDPFSLTVSLESMGEVQEFETWLELAEWVSDISVRHSEIQNYEVVNLAHNYSAVMVDRQDGSVTLELANPHSDLVYEVQMNTKDKTREAITHYYTD